MIRESVLHAKILIAVMNTIYNNQPVVLIDRALSMSCNDILVEQVVFYIDFRPGVWGHANYVLLQGFWLEIQKVKASWAKYLYILLKIY